MHPRSLRLVIEPDLFEPSVERAAPSVLRVRPAPPPPAGPPRGPQDQAALVLEPRELWVAAHVPDLPLAALQTAASSADRSAPLVVVDATDRNQRVIAADARARNAGVRVGMTLGAALAAAPDIDPRPRDTARELALMQGLAAIAATFTPLVSLAPPDGLLLEIKPSIRLFGGLRQLCRQLREACLASPMFAAGQVPPHFTLAPTALAALAAARAGARCFITDPAVLPARLKPLPLDVLRWPEAENQRLAAMGVNTLGELMRLPRAGFARRFGPAQLADLDRLLGRRADPRQRVAKRERYRGSRDLDHEIHEHERLLRALEPLLAELEEFLRARQRGITSLRCRFRHYRAEPTLCVLRLAQPEASAARLGALLRERLATLVLPEPVRRCELASGALTARDVASQSLWSPGEHGSAPTGEMPALVEHLRARLGPAAVYGLAQVAEHRPERAWRARQGTDLFIGGPDNRATGASPASPASIDGAGSFARPLWLLHQPEPLGARRGRPQHGGPLELLAGPERIESGWWDGADIQRDYYVAQSAAGTRLWIYRDAPTHAWFLHGIFG
ncbi:MAG TPA: DNA polymerase Y family protein [Steroidobacteraceae bacterium]|nr:DNA polymerase Y family protein [Steroidobacteraceae bacterium]